jgi:hypothetical protein
MASKRAWTVVFEVINVYAQNFRHENIQIIVVWMNVIEMLYQSRGHGKRWSQHRKSCVLVGPADRLYPAGHSQQLLTL